jgi:preprotein translocase subunit YajC
MNLLNAGLMLAMGASPAGSQQNPKGAVIGNLGFLVIMVVLFYFVLIRPQSKKQKEHAAMLKTVRKGDKIVTNGGIVAEVITVKEKTLSIRSADAKLEVSKAAVAEITERSGEPSQS